MDNRQSKHETNLKFSQETYIPIWIEAFLVDRKAAGMAPGTQMFYRQKLANFQAFCDSLAITQIDQLTPATIREYIIHLEQRGHTSGGVHSFYRALRAFLNWWEMETEPEAWRNPMRRVKPPKVTVELLEPADLQAVQAIQETCSGKTPNDLRDKAIILFLLDTGVRASELIAIDLEDVDPIRGDVLIRQGKGRKPRTVFIGKKTRKALRAWLRVRRGNCPALFVGQEGERLGYQGLRMMVRRRAERAGVRQPPLHSFRRFFALTYLRNGGDIFTLQKLMGHADLQILRRYLNQVDEDLERGHRQYGPVDSLNL